MICTPGIALPTWPAGARGEAGDTWAMRQAMSQQAYTLAKDYMQKGHHFYSQGDFAQAESMGMRALTLAVIPLALINVVVVSVMVHLGDRYQDSIGLSLSSPLAMFLANIVVTVVALGVYLALFWLVPGVKERMFRAPLRGTLRRTRWWEMPLEWGREAVAMTRAPLRRRANWIAMEPTPPAPAVISRVPASCGRPRRSCSRSNRASQAVIVVSGMAAACAKSSVRGLCPTMRSSTRCSSALVPLRAREPA